MDFIPSQRLRSQMAPSPSHDSLAHTLPVPVFVAVKRLKQIRRYARCAFQGFFQPENDRKGRYIWTEGDASIECHFPTTIRLQYAWIEVASTAPDGSKVSVQLNNEQLVNDQHVKGRSTIVAKLPRPELFHRLTLKISSDTFEAGSAGENSDQRSLGIAIRGVVFGKRATKYRAGSFYKPTISQRFAKVLPWRKRKKERSAAA